MREQRVAGRWFGIRAKKAQTQDKKGGSISRKGSGVNSPV